MPRNPALYQINTRVWLTALSKTLGRRATLDDIPDAELDRLAGLGFDWVWLLSVWQTGAAARAISRANPEWRAEFQHTLPDLTEDDIGGSGFAITGYTVHTDLGGDAALARVRERLRQRGLRLMLDFVPNHMAPDHPWVQSRPDYFVPGTEKDLAESPANFTRLGNAIFAHGRDPYFPGWPDTVQLDYSNPATQSAMAGELLRIAGQCDGVRCDMAMLVLPEVFERTWGRKTGPFWPGAIRQVREAHPGFCFMAEVYWDLEWTLQQQGFDYTYDKRLYDRLAHGLAGPARDHLRAEIGYQSHMARFLENHDEPRAAAAFPPGRHQAAAAITFLSPGLRFLHQGQMEGATKRISPHLVRGPAEPRNDELGKFYARLLAILRRPTVRDSAWQLLDCAAAWDGNPTHDDFIAFGWRMPGQEPLLVAVNYSPHAGQCLIPLPWPELGAGNWSLTDLLGEAGYVRGGEDLRTRGMYLDVPAWTAHAFALRESP